MSMIFKVRWTTEFVGTLPEYPIRATYYHELWLLLGFIPIFYRKR